MPIVGVPPFILLVEFDENFFVEPGLSRGVRVSFVIALKKGPLLQILVGRVLLVVLHEQANDLKRLVLHALDVKVHLGANLVLGGAGFSAGVRIEVVDGTLVARGDDRPAACLLLKVIEQLYKDKVDILLIAEDRQAVPGAPLTVRDKSFRLNDGWI